MNAKGGKARVLLIDDDLNCLQAYQRMLGRRFEVDTADQPAAGLAKALSDQEYAVVVCDLHMPKINGLDLLAAVRDHSPNTTRILFTGDSDLHRAVDAVNEGVVFRFLCKPSPVEVLIRALEAGVKEYELQRSAELFMRDTLTATVEMMTQLFALQSPRLARGHARRLGLVRMLAAQLRLVNAWEFELAAALADIGKWTMGNPPDGQAESPEKISARMLEDIRYLDDVHRMIASSNQTAEELGLATLKEAPRWAVGAQLLKLTADYDALRTRGLNARAALQELKVKRGGYLPEAHEALERTVTRTFDVQHMSSDALKPGAVLGEDLLGLEGQILAGRGQRVTHALREMVHQQVLAGGYERRPVKIMTAGQS